ncbi:MAG: FG-GAP-like repeat-containing protein [Patescibacteria group bacterium]|jgi:Icc-related predicted phosphoesterase
MAIGKSKVIYFISAIFFFSFFTCAKAEEITYNDCYLLSRTDNNLSLRMQGVEASFVVSGAVGQTYSISLQNLDPDYLLISAYNAGTLTRSANNISFQTTIAFDPQTITIAPWYEPTDDFYFAALSDNQPTSGSEVNPVFSDFIENINTINPYFTINAGDTVAGSSDDAALAEMHQAYVTALNNANTPFFSTAGNHDDNGSDLDGYKQYLGDYNSDFDFANTHFALASSVDYTSSYGFMSETNRDYLESSLSATSLGNKIVVSHHPLYLPSWATVGYDDEGNRNAVAQIIDEQNTDLVINGHIHGYDYSFINSSLIPTVNTGYYQLISGGAGGTLRLDEGYYHFTLHHVQGDQITHTVIQRDDFYVSQSYSNNNDGTEDLSAIKVYNDDVTDWPWIRLKFKLSPETEHIYAYDESGNYYSLQEKMLDSYHVAYLETSLLAQSEKTFTVAKSTKIHEGLINTVYNDGEVTYNSAPVNSATETGLTVTPSVDTTEIEIDTWNRYGDFNKKWTSSSPTSIQTLNFTVTDLLADYLYQFKVNGVLKSKYYPDVNGQIAITYESNNDDNTFELIKENSWLPKDLTIIPASDGSPQVRIFNGDGDLLSQFYAFSQSWQGGFNILQADVNGDRAAEIVVTPKAGLTPKISVYNSDGHLLAEKKVFSEDHKQGLTIKAGDIDDNGKQEIIVAPQGSGNNQVKIYRYNETKEELKLVISKKVYPSSFTGGIDIAIGDINDNNKPDIVVAPYSGQASVKIFKFASSRLKPLGQINNYFSTDYSGTSVAIGNIDKKGKAEILLAPKSNGNQLKVYRLKGENLKLIKKKIINFALGYNLASADLTGNFRDEIILAPNEGGSYLRIYQYNKQKKIALLDKVTPYGNGYNNGMNIGLFDTDENWDLELVVAPTAESPNVRVYDYENGAMSLLSWFWGFAQNFTGGVSL